MVANLAFPRLLSWARNLTQENNSFDKLVFCLPQVLSPEESIFVRDFVLKYSRLTLPYPEIFVCCSKDRS